MPKDLKARICTDALSAPLGNLSALYLKVDCPDGSELITGANAVQIEEAADCIRQRFGLDLMPLVLAEIERHHRSTHVYRHRMPDDLIAMIEPVAMAAE